MAEGTENEERVRVRERERKREREREREREKERGREAVGGEGCLETVAVKPKRGGVLEAEVRSGVAVATGVSHCLAGFSARWEGLDQTYGA